MCAVCIVCAVFCALKQELSGIVSLKQSAVCTGPFLDSNIFVNNIYTRFFQGDMQKTLFIKSWEGLNIFPCPTYSELHATKKCNNSFDVQKYPKMLWLSSHIMFFSDVGNTDGWKQKRLL